MFAFIHEKPEKEHSRRNEETKTKNRSRDESIVIKNHKKQLFVIFQIKKSRQPTMSEIILIDEESDWSDSGSEEEPVVPSGWDNSDQSKMDKIWTDIGVVTEKTKMTKKKKKRSRVAELKEDLETLKKLKVTEQDFIELGNDAKKMYDAKTQEIVLLRQRNEQLEKDLKNSSLEKAKEYEDYYRFYFEAYKRELDLKYDYKTKLNVAENAKAKLEMEYSTLRESIALALNPPHSN